MTKYRFRIILMLVQCLFSCFFLHAQDSVNSTGGEATGNGGTVAFSVGQVLYTSNVGSTGIIEQGVQHAYEIIGTGVDENIFNNSISLFPNPFTDNLTLQIECFYEDIYNYKIFDIQGKLLTNQKINAHQTIINMLAMPADTYIIQVNNQEDKKVYSFKIVKI